MIRVTLGKSPSTFCLSKMASRTIEMKQVEGSNSATDVSGMGKAERKSERVLVTGE